MPFSSFPAPRPPSAPRGWPARLGIARIAALTLALGLAAPAARAQPRYTITTAQIHDALAEKMPRRYPVAGLLDLDLQVPQLRMLPAQNRVNAVLPVIASGPLLSGGQRGYAGTFDVDFALRYEASDRTLRAHQVHVNTLRIDGLKPPMSELLNTYAQQLATQSLGEVVLHTLRPQDLALADGLGMQPGPITVTERGLRVDFVQKPVP
ncbi:DUF1439 domain-containing protein [Paracidovorax konjaci]|uniref:DUF1439 domain-containing protein n=1 Tax=Paracidovorax konjaci TaxID=32040 RepID=A0A1I1W876_9BURK|nr:DUF1439 domain-containing protein [Paracidovorax konjaci]SFD89603.1 hypothetical protein SAMN04489710_10883 [Paracidovorax konjaci]